ncbi:MAG: capsular polysaccharide transport system permease protein, partial [Acetobacteraceae bacterium]|nr:capsular polysaccharide transport system permease protein [Acetobacteraceae bacterium]
MSRLRSHFDVFYALIIRDLMTRFGRQHLGFVWTILEPMILCTGVMFVWSFIHDPLIHGMPVVELVFTGYMPLTL